MPTPQKKHIFWFEDDPLSHKEFVDTLRGRYEVTIGAKPSLIEQENRKPIDLVIVDLMIYRRSEGDTEGGEDNLAFEGINHRYTGHEFLRRLRAGEYEEHGFPPAVPVIVLTGVADKDVQEMAKLCAGEGGPYAFFEKPIALDTLIAAIEELLDPQRSTSADE